MAAKRKSQSSRTMTPKSASRRRKTSPRNRRVGSPTKKWSAQVTRQSDALDLQKEVFKGTPVQIARSLKRSAERSRRRKSTPYRSAMSMLTFYINRGGKNLSATRRKNLEKAKEKLREAFGRARK